MKQKGFTLVEVLVVLAVGSVLLTGAVLSIQQLTMGTGRSNSQVIALTDVNQAALRIKKDLMMIQNTDLTDNVPQPGSVWLGWTDYTGLAGDNATHSISYTLAGTELKRTYDDATTSIVGRNITSIVFTQDGRVISATITATGPGFPPRSKTLTFSVYTRTEGIE